MTLREIGRSVSNTLLRGVGRVSSNVQESKSIPVDLLESDDAVLAVFDAPGTSRDDVQVRFSEGSLHIRIDRFREEHDGFETVFPGRGLALTGEVELPADVEVDPNAATATITGNGTLEIHVPKVDRSDETQDDGLDVEV
ncbi:Hsp20/alpha crystallin family protein [Natranaeroarchaeum sulfidigenes]|uniref:Molecular chaperone (HSP20 family) n=1 Tax=Natranaeroarchaeum sulfidigenes TaxID=2784880 RepID=A0A897MY91_9EURY|nr:Hsp20 family protein [Natranaeroarchaeum sulfidigenes]QSG03315.1 Molecular chaperone (HSP20 family) [Natranaeroarchaeum sulfidigenes]